MGILPIGVVAWQRLRAAAADACDGDCGPARRSAADLVALRSPGRFARAMALGQRHHRASRLAGLARLVCRRRRLHGKARGISHRTRNAARRRCSAASVSSAPWRRSARYPGSRSRSRPLLWAWLDRPRSPTFTSSLPSSASTTTCIRCFRCARSSSAAPRRRRLGAARTATESQIARGRALCGSSPASRWPFFSKAAPPSRPTTLTTRACIATRRRSTRPWTEGALVVIGHYGPDVQYYIDRFGWEEDPALWTPFDEESAIAKGARYFISIEDNRLRRNLELCAWLQRFPVRNPSAAWIVYETDPRKTLPGADAFWRSFRRAERAGNGRAFLDRTALCSVRPLQRPMPSNSRKSAANASG